MNKHFIKGNVGRDPEIKFFESGDKVAIFSVATNKSWKDKETGEKKSHTEWHNCVVFGKLVDVIEKYVTKGKELLIVGEPRTRSYDKKDGTKGYVHEVVIKELEMLGGKSSETAPPPLPPEQQTTTQTQEPGEPEDDLPF